MKRSAWMAGLCALACLFGGPALAAPCTDSVNRLSPVLQNGFAGNTLNNRYNRSQIHSGNVSRLRLALSHAADGAQMEKRGAPAVTEQAVFFSAGRSIVAMNRVSGCTYWSYTIPARTTPLVGSNAVRSSAIHYINENAARPAMIVAGDFYGTMYALNAVNGAPIWSRFVGTEPEHHMITGAPQFHRGMLLVPVASKEVLSTISEVDRICCTSHGLLQALDAYTGATLWTYHTSADAVYNAETRSFAPNGMSLWGAPTIDAERNRVYIGTGQNLAPPATNNSDAIVALDMSNGRPIWTFQSTANDSFNIGCGLPPPLNLDCLYPAGPDFDFGAPPILARDLCGRDAVIAGGKNGVVYSLDAASGRVNWSRRIGTGGTLGGIHWGMAADGGRVYAAVSDIAGNKAAALPILGLLTRTTVEQVPGARSGIYAICLRTGRLMWEAHPRHTRRGIAHDSIFSAALSVTNDVLFAGSLDGVVRALRTSDGSELWSQNTALPFTDVDGKNGHGGAIDSVGAVVAGSDLLVNSGYDTFGGLSNQHAGPGNGLFIYRLN